MKTINVVRLDSKGRLLIPYHIREMMSLNNRTEMMIINNEMKEIRVFPLLNNSAMKLKLVLKDSPGSVSVAARTLAEHKLEILMSEIKVIEKGKTAHWLAILDVSKCQNINASRKALESLDAVSFVELTKP